MENIIFSPYQYNKGYISLPLKLTKGKLIESISIHNTTNLLLKKDSFHVSLVCIKAILEKLREEQRESIEQEIINIFNRLTEKNPIHFLRFNNDFRFVKKENKESLIVTCTTSDLSDLFQQISKVIGFNVEPPPTHVTLYTLQKNVGIGINNAEELQGTESVSSEETAPIWSVLEKGIETP